MGKTPISKQGYQTLLNKYNSLLKEERPKVVSEVTFAAAQGDRSENAEYIFGKKRLREIDHELSVLQRRIDNVIVIEQAPEDRGCIRFGATVELESDKGKKMTATLVGKDEIDPTAGKFSVESPIGKALLGHRANDIVEVIIPRGKATWAVKNISYD